ncbi:MAG: sulfatase-like hydrolase/transferase [Myxococcota bacterium]|nr:sulfatase-like hydrolase/transferase [Myxococcota bacterium]
MRPRRYGLALPLVGALLGLACTETETPTSPPSRGEPPNIVLILLDDADVRDFAFYEPEGPIALPTIEALARDGVVFDQFYASSPVCSPTRAAILTGQYPARYGLNEIVARESSRGLPSRAPMLAAYLRERGYATAHVGKWHLGSRAAALLPSAKGFAHTVTTGPWRGYQHTTVLVDGVELPADPDRHLSARLTDHALRFVREHRDERFFLNLWYFAPHIPLQPPAEWAAKHPADRVGRYAALMGHLDHQIGRIVSELDALGLRDRTAILLLSDNGGTGPIHNRHSLPLRGAKKAVFEGGIRSPLVLLWPGRTEAGRRNASVTTTMDLFPTVVELLGDDPHGLDLDGDSFAAALAGRHLERRGPLFWQSRASSVDLVRARSAPGYLSLFAVRDGEWKLVMNGQTLSLFDLSTDPAEATDLAAEQPEITRRLLDEYDAWRLRTSKLPMIAASQSGATRTSRDVYEFSGPGRVVFEADLLHDATDGELSCRLRLRADSSGRVQRILGKGEAWKLVLDETDHLELRFTDQTGATHAWRSTRALAIGKWHDLAVSFSALRSSRLSRVFVEGAVAIQARHEHPIASSNSPIALGADDAQSFSGTIEGIACYALGLTRNDL